MISKPYTIPRTAEACFSTEPSAEVRNVWLLLHGYGQLARYFIRHFEPFFSTDTLFVAAEGLSHFYLEGTSGRVGASWMTKHKRERDIRDIGAWLDILQQDIAAAVHPQVRWNVLAFSQGCAVALRWLYASPLQPAKVVLWGGTLPHDIAMPQQQAWLNRTDLHIVNGDRDPFLQNVNLTDIRKVFDGEQIRYTWHTFGGGHQLHEDTIRTLIQD
ncbi:MAG: alpha/beta hydrolase [Flavobacteriales bacterium]